MGTVEAGNTLLEIQEVLKTLTRMTGKAKGKKCADRVMSQTHINKKEALDYLRFKLSISQCLVSVSALPKKG